MSSRLAALTAKRVALQLECDVRRGDIRQIYSGLEGRAARADRVIDAARGYAPVIAAGGIAVLFVLGPSRALSLARRALTIAFYASQFRRLVG